MIYYTIILILAFFSFDLQFNKRKSPLKLFGALSILLFIVVGGLRYEVGTDWYSYKDLYLSIGKLPEVITSRVEFLFGLLIIGSKSIYFSYSFFIFLLFLISFFLKYRVVKKISPDIFFSLIIYIYTLFIIYDINGVRQGLAIGLALASIPSIQNNNLIRFLGIMLTATFFHTSAVIFIPMFWISRISLSPKMLFIILSITLVATLPLRSIIENSQFFLNFFKTDQFSHYAVYVESEYFGRDISILSLALFQRIFVFLLFYLNLDKIDIRSELKVLLLNGYFLSLLVFLLLSFSSDLATRISYYFKALELFIIPLIIFSQTDLFKKFILWITFLLFGLFGIYRILEIPDGGLIPYKNLLWQ